MRLNITCYRSRIFYFVLIGFLIFPSLVFADHSDLHSNTQSIEALNEFLLEGDLAAILLVFAFISGFSAGSR